MRKELPQQLLRELLTNSKRSDRELAKVLKVSQPTITRARSKLEKDGIIEGYTVIPDFKKMGFEIMAINLVKIRPKILSPDITERARRFISRFPNTIFASAGEGLGMTGVSISFYQSFTEYQKIVNRFRTEWKDLSEDFQSFVVVIEEGEFKRFSTAHLKDLPL